jgi:uncharacterized protein (DUF302 family)
LNYGKSVKLTLTFSAAVPEVKEAFAARAFGTLTEIDVQATLQGETGGRIEPYAILGACNPHLVHQAVELTRSIGLPLSGNVVLSQREGGVVVQASHPSLIATLPGDPALQPMADEAARPMFAGVSPTKPVDSESVRVAGTHRGTNHVPRNR